MQLRYIGIFLAFALFIFACQSEAEMNFARYYANGKDIYVAKCQNCHGANGEGLGMLAPALTDSVFLKNEKQNLACFIKNGTKKALTINGKTSQEEMPAFAEMQTIDIAQVITYITNTFGNKQGIYLHTSVDEDLSNCK